MIKSQAGSAAVLGMIVLMMFITMSAGLLPWVTNEVRMATMSKDVVEAEDAAEAGVKRAINEFNKVNRNGTPDFSWLNSDRAFINNVNSKKYNVIVYLSSDTTKTPVIPVVTSNNVYTIQSTGTVGGAKKIVSATMTITAGSSGGGTNTVLSNYPVFSQSDLYIYGGSSPAPVININIGTTGNSVNITSPNAFFSGKLYTSTAPTGWYPNGSKDSNGNPNWYVQESASQVGTLNASIPTMPVPTVNKPTTLPVTSGNQYWNGSYTLSNTNYYYNGSYALEGTSTFTANGSQAILIYINGNFSMDTSASIIGTNLTIFVNGSFSMANNSSINATNLKIYSTGNIHLTNSAAITGNNITIQTTSNSTGSSNGASICMDSTSSINKNKTTGITSIFSNGSVDFTNQATIGGSAGIVATSNAITVDNQVQAPNTIFISTGSNSQSYITGSSGAYPPANIAGIYTAGSLKIDGSPIINGNNQEAIVLQSLGSALQSLGLGGGSSTPGSATINPGSWAVN